ncbi:hypothetical protein ANCCAN_15840 [Ancylostoma caninum]|uniref:Uncharacterized protein n=1 Tax=Ancylostoma caninum TaxID=29170 RepID=A0A368G5I3_ANCCA|nr:hypothetical protein ANCCAN_15840 [Ancylostoma caninum]
MTGGGIQVTVMPPHRLQRQLIRTVDHRLGAFIRDVLTACSQEDNHRGGEFTFSIPDRNNVPAMVK